MWISKGVFSHRRERRKEKENYLVKKRWGNTWELVL